MEQLEIDLETPAPVTARLTLSIKSKRGEHYYEFTPDEARAVYYKLHELGSFWGAPWTQKN